MTNLPKILVVDDNANNRLSIRTVLKGVEAVLHEADNGFDALLLTLSNHYALILLDVNMPEMDGFEVCEQLRANPHTAKTPVIFITAAHKDIEDNIRGYDAGATDYLTKPINDYVLRAKTQIFLQLYHQQQALVQANEELSISAIAFNSQEGIVVTNANAQILRVNKAFTDVTGYSPAEVIGHTPAILQSGLQNVEFYKEVWETLLHKHFWQGEIWNKRKNGEVYPEWLTITAVINEAYEITHYVGVFSDFTQRKATEESLRISEQRFRDVSDAVGEYLWEVDAQLHYVYLSSRTLLVKGYTPTELIGHTPMDFVLENDAIILQAAIEQAIMNKTPFKVQCRNVSKSATVFWEEITGVPLYDEEGIFSGLRGAGLNITDRKQTEEEMQLALLVYENSSEAMAVIDQKDNIMTINPAFTKITGYTLEEVITHQIKIFSGDRNNKNFWQELSKKGYWQGEVWNQRKSGERYPLWLTINTIFNSDGTPHRRVALFSDMTERKILEARIQQSTQELLQSEKMAALGQLIAGIAHEINTPLGAISSSANNMRKFLAQTLTVMPTLFRSFTEDECAHFVAILNRTLSGEHHVLSAKEQRQNRRALTLLLDGEVENPEDIADTLIDMGIYDNVEEIVPLLKRTDGEQILELAYKLSEIKKGAQTISTATDRASKIVFALKSYSHQNAAQQKTLINLADSIETVLTLYQNQLKHDIELVKCYEESLPQLACYPDDLNQVWTNLIHNSLQAMHYQGTLTIRIFRRDEYLCVTIQDNGDGITVENMPKIFDPFFTTKAVGEGSGLGLHIIKQIVEKHQGTIEVDSVSGCTQFTVVLPLITVEEPLALTAE